MADGRWKHKARIKTDPTDISVSVRHEIQTDLLRYEIRVVDVFLQLQQDLRPDIVLVIVHQTPEEIGISQ